MDLLPSLAGAFFIRGASFLLGGLRPAGPPTPSLAGALRPAPLRRGARLRLAPLLNLEPLEPPRTPRTPRTPGTPGTPGPWTPRNPGALDPRVLQCLHRPVCPSSECRWFICRNVRKVSTLLFVVVLASVLLHGRVGRVAPILQAPTRNTVVVKPVPDDMSRTCRG